MIKKLREWRKDRHLELQDHKVYIENIYEELLEAYYTKEFIQEVKQEFKENLLQDDIKVASEHEVVDAIADIIVFSINQLELMGYDADKVMNETIKEISSRKQDPIQQELWFKSGYDGTKWMKDLNQDPSTLYKADYNKGKK